MYAFAAGSTKMRRNPDAEPNPGSRSLTEERP